MTATIDRLQREREAQLRAGNANAVVTLDNELAVARQRAEVEAQIRAERDAAARRAAAERIEANARATLAEAEAHHIVVLRHALELVDQLDECAEEISTVKARIRQAKRLLGDKTTDWLMDTPRIPKDWSTHARRVIKRADESSQEHVDGRTNE